LVIGINSDQHNGFECKMVNALGEVLRTFEIDSNQEKYYLDVDDISSGVYFITFTDQLNYSRATKKVMKF